MFSVKGTPSIKSGKSTFSSLQLIPHALEPGNFQAQHTATSVSLDDTLTITVPMQFPAVMVEKANEPNSFFFVISDAVSTPNKSDVKPSSAKRVGIIWDASVSRSSSNTKQEITVLGTILRELSQQCSVTVSVSTFSAAFNQLPYLTLTIERGAEGSVIDQLTNNLLMMVFTGGTNLGAIKASKQAETTEMDYYMLFTDGLSNMGDDDAAVIEKPLYVFSSAPKVNHTLLKQWARKSGGQYYDLRQSHDAKQIARRMGEPPYSFLLSKHDDTVQEVYPREPTPLSVPPSSSAKVSWKVAGKFVAKRNEDGNLRPTQLTLSYGGSNGSVENVHVLEGGFAAAMRGGGTGVGLVARFWASKKVEHVSL